jgi:hypothetical protein
VLSPDADASRAESYKKATDLIVRLWPSSVCRHSPLFTSQTLTVVSCDADASRAESYKKATELTVLLWPSSVYRQALYLSFIAGFIVIHFGFSFLKRSFIRLRTGLNKSVDVYV